MRNVAEEQRVAIEDVPGERGRNLFIAGEWRPASNGATFDDLNPKTPQPMVRVANGSVADIAAAHAAQPGWAQLLPAARGLLPQGDRGVRPASAGRADEPHCPFGGVTASGWVGKWGGAGAIEAFTDQQWISTQVAARQYPF